MSNTDLYQQVVKTIRNIGAYAAMPGTGPEGKKCKDCARMLRVECSKTYFKCGYGRVTNGKATDIRSTAPACKYFEQKVAA